MSIYKIVDVLIVGSAMTASRRPWMRWRWNSSGLERDSGLLRAC